MKKLIILTLLSTSIALASNMVWVVVWPNGSIMGIKFATIDGCKRALAAHPSGSVCMGVIDD